MKENTITLIEASQAAQTFLEVWGDRPFENTNGLNINGSLALYYFLQRLNAKVVIEVGTWRGFSTWVVEQALPEAEILTSDPILASRQFLDPKHFQPEYRTVKSHYTYQDFSVLGIQVPPEEIDSHVAFFDDHQDKFPRLLQAKQKGFKHLIFDDNVPFKYSHKTFENHRENADDWSIVTEFIEDYEIFPPLYDGRHFRHQYPMNGLNITPQEPYFSQRNFYSYVTYVKLKTT